MTLRIVFMGTPDFAVPTLAELIGQGHEIVAVYSQPPGGVWPSAHRRCSSSPGNSASRC
jgi:methionyl-tRNA formyltransferase